MSYITAIDTSSLSNQDISSALLAHMLTNTTRVRKIWLAIELDQIVGVGDYVVYATIQRGGSGSHFRVSGEAITASGGVTSLMFSSFAVILNVSDVLKIYVVGQSGDTTTPDVTTRVWEELSGDIDAAAVENAIWDAARSGHVVAGTFGATDEWAGSSLTAQQTRDAMKLAPTAGAPAAGSVDAHLDAIQAQTDTIDDIKAVTDALDVTAVTQVAASSAGHLTITVGLTFDEAVTGLTIPADWEAALWTLKNNARDADTAALVQLRASNPAAGTDGLQRLNGAALVAPITAADGALTVTQASGRIDVWLSDEMTAMLGAATAIGWDVKFIDASGDSSGQRGTADVVLTETKATA